MVDAAHEKETRARETIQSLKLEIANLSKLVEQGAGLTMGQEHRYIVVHVRDVQCSFHKMKIIYSALTVSKLNKTYTRLCNMLVKSIYFV